MKIAVLTSGRLPVPAVLGGAVENLIDFYLEYNDMHHLHDITVYSIKSDKIKSPDTACNHYYYVNNVSSMSFIALTKVNLMRLLLGPVPQLEPCHNICILQVFLQI